MALDVSSEEAWAAVVVEVERRLGRLGALVNNAALGNLASVEQESAERWDRVIG